MVQLGTSREQTQKLMRVGPSSGDGDAEQVDMEVQQLQATNQRLESQVRMCLVLMCASAQAFVCVCVRGWVGVYMGWGIL